MPEFILLDHWSWGELSSELVENIIIPQLWESYLGLWDDSMILACEWRQFAITTDSFVADPIFFMNGDIGKLAVCWTVNDLAVSWATPYYLTLSLIIEEGFSISDLSRILHSIKMSALEANIKIVAWDTKVVGKWQADKIFINTAWIWFFDKKVDLNRNLIKPWDDIIVTGYLGNHSIHLLSMRHWLWFENRVSTDCAPLNHMIKEISMTKWADIRYMRDITRGGLGSILNEISQSINYDFELQMKSLPIQHETKMATELLWISPLYLANEWNLCIFCDPSSSKSILKTLKNNKYWLNAQVVWKVSSNKEKKVIWLSESGESTIIWYLKWKELPRLC